MASPCAEPEPSPPRLVGESPAMRRAIRQLRRAARHEATVLLLGETGTGKSLAARLVHARSARARGPFVVVDCAALARGVLESELFGHERGAFTGAVARHRGRLERAAGGTLFLDEIGELPLALQAKLLSALEERVFERVGGDGPLALDARIVAATHRPLEEDVRAGRFRADLYYRLRVVALELPPLRERRGDLLALVGRSLPELARRLGLPPPPLAPGFLARLEAHAWPGNVRELLHVLERALILSDGGALSVADLEGALAPDGAPGGLRQAAAPGAEADVEASQLAQVLRDTGGNVARAARRLGLPRSTLRYRIQRHGLANAIPRD